jgi:hypothetical protein
MIQYWILLNIYKLLLLRHHSCVFQGTQQQLVQLITTLQHTTTHYTTAPQNPFIHHYPRMYLGSQFNGKSCATTCSIFNSITTTALQQQHCNNSIATTALQQQHYNNITTQHHNNNNITTTTTSQQQQHTTNITIPYSRTRT